MCSTSQWCPCSSIKNNRANTINWWRQTVYYPDNANCDVICPIFDTVGRIIFKFLFLVLCLLAFKCWTAAYCLFCYLCVLHLTVLVSFMFTKWPEVGSTEYKSIAVLFQYRYRYRRYFSKMVLKYRYRATFWKSVQYFQFFVITYRLKIKLSLSLEGSC